MDKGGKIQNEVIKIGWKRSWRASKVRIISLDFILHGMEAIRGSYAEYDMAWF